MLQSKVFRLSFPDGARIAVVWHKLPGVGDGRDRKKVFLLMLTWGAHVLLV